MAAEEDSEECTSKLLSTITDANYLQRRRKSSRWRIASCLTASSFRHRSWPQLRRSLLSAVVVAWFGWHGRSSAASARDGA